MAVGGVEGACFPFNTHRLRDCAYSSCEGRITTRRDYSHDCLLIVQYFQSLILRSTGPTLPSYQSRNTRHDRLTLSFIYRKVRSNGRYEKNALDSFGEQTAGAAAAFTRKVSAAAGTARTTLTSKNPTETVPILLGLLGVTAAAVNYETSLQFLGVLGVELTIINKITSYGSPLALLEDVKKGAGTLADVVGKVPVSAVAMPGKPSTPPPPPAKKEAPVGAWPPPGAKVKAERIKDMKAAKTEDKVPVVKKEEKAPVEEKKVPEVKVEETPVDKKEKQVIAKTEDGSFVFSADAVDKSPDTLPEEKVEQKKDM